MKAIETDYLVIGAGAAGMSFTDALIDSDRDCDVVMVDRRHAPGGHWNDAYPFVRLHQPAACYGVNSRPLGNDQIDERGLNAGLYQQADGVQICDYFRRVMDEHHVASGQVRFFPMSNSATRPPIPRFRALDPHLIVPPLLPCTESMASSPKNN